jgi:hypothetical protein
MKGSLNNERSKIIPIYPSSPTNKYLVNEYSLKENFFDPSKSSPPNEFMKKLQQRMNIYNSYSPSALPVSFSFSFIKDDNREIE